MAAEWKNLTDGSFKGFTFSVALPQKARAHGMVSQQIVHERKLQVVDQPLVDGSGTNDFGRKGRVISAQLVFHGNNLDKDLKSFLDLCNEGTPGILNLPDEPVAINASFQRATVKSEVGQANSKSVEVTWIESDQVAPAHFGSTVGSGFKKSIPEQAAISKSLLGDVISAVNSNPVLAAIRKAETGLSTIRSAVNAVTSLAEGVRNRIAQIDGEIRGTLAQITDAIDDISKLLGGSSSAQQVTFSSSVDVITGQVTADFNDPDEVTPAPNPLVNDQNPATRPVTLTSITSPDSAIIALNALAAQITSNRDELVGDTSGRTNDVYKALTSALATIQDMKASILTESKTLVVVPFELSLLEICFFNGLTVDDVDTVYKSNRHITDPLVVAAGTVIAI